ncbi:hypothetical protein L0B53_01735 [Vibrio sp. SS-MA-C1-2]|uniref:AAA family ATPase n=1 Tax=Vibrio sp. SS-MA-C1-2 TaxID=2908646 RepID=UPI001F3D0686|nr:hypothetical protein [Vibrio sp. SS-MA-C1-2]UJF17517.1 hypothetical protein L0B53_01735 [Vibrio sp. SS-MA-C1-2]
MFDLADELSFTIDSKSKPKQQQQQIVSGITLFYQSNESKSLVEEVCRFEAWDDLHCLSCDPDKAKPEQLGQTIILDLIGNENLLQDVELLNNKIANNRSIIVLGSDDSISVLRQLEKMGFYYLPWPATRDELIRSIKQVANNQAALLANGYFRKAKQVAVLGCRGGVGTTVISAEIASGLAKKGSRSVLVDHHFHNSNVDIILNRKDLEKVELSKISVEIDKLDEESAAGYLSEISHNFQYFALDGDAKNELLESHTNTICHKLERQVNFIVNDYSASVDFKLDIERVVRQHNVIVIVVDPSISCVRSGQKILEKVSEAALIKDDKLRVIVVLNHHRPTGSFNLNREEVERFLKCKVDIEISFIKNAAALLIDGKRLHTTDNKKSSPFSDLAKIVNGEDPNQKSSFVQKLKSRLGK